MKSILFGLLLLPLLGSATAVAGRGNQVRYVGVHPIAKAHGGGACYIEGPHVHVYPADKVQYRDHRGASFFAGDPVAYGYDGPKHAYKGHHPIHVHEVVEIDAVVEPDVEFCYLDGAHYHAFAAPSGPDFKVVGGVTFYVGTPPPVYLEARPAMVQINATYRPLVYARPVVTVDAPVGWIGAHVEVGGPAVVVAPPSAHVDVVIPAPSVRVDVGFGIGVGGGTVIHHDDGHRHKKFKGRKKHKKHKDWR